MHSDHPDAWLGNEEQYCDRLDPGAVERVAAALGMPAPADGDVLPPLWHWAFFQPAPEADSLNEDGHPRTGGFLPPMHGLQRMWAGSRLKFQGQLRVGVPASRQSRISQIKQKQGRNAGAMTFVTVDHHYHQAGQEVLHEQQDLVYREPRPLQPRAGEPLPKLDWSRTVKPRPMDLFRYSAVTFNAHRIHYDWPYATETEGYAGLVVHGPLLATLMVDAFLKAHPHCRLSAFRFRGLRPVLCPGDFVVGGVHEEDGTARVFAGDSNGQSQIGTIEYQSA